MRGRSSRRRSCSNSVPPRPAHDDTSRLDTSRGDDASYRDDATYADGRTSADPGYATDEDRRFAPVDTSRADGVRVERGGLGRGHGGTEFEHDLPRDERPRS